MPSTEIPTARRVRLTAGLVRRHQRGLYRYLRFLGCDDGLAEDLCQEAFLRIVVSPPEDRGRNALGRWLRVTSLNLFRNTGRSPRAGVVLDPERLEQLWQRQVRDDSEAYLAALRHCLEKLDAPQRDAVVRRHQRGQSRAVIAAALGLTLEGCKSVLRRARGRLHACIERQLRSSS